MKNKIERTKDGISITNDSFHLYTADQITRRAFLSITVDGERYDVDAHFDIDGVPDSEVGFLYKVIGSLQGYNVIKPTEDP